MFYQIKVLVHLLKSFRGALDNENALPYANWPQYLSFSVFKLENSSHSTD